MKHIMYILSVVFLLMSVISCSSSNSNVDTTLLPNESIVAEPTADTEEANTSDSAASEESVSSTEPTSAIPSVALYETIPMESSTENILENGDISFVSPNQKYTLTAVKSTNSLLKPVYRFLYLKDAAGDVNISFDKMADIYHISAAWSKDSRYMIVRETESKGAYAKTILIFDVENQTVSELPRLEIQNRIHAELPDINNLYSCDLSSCEWTDADANVLKVCFDMRVGTSFYTKSNPGYYIYDLNSQSIVDLQYTMNTDTPEAKSYTDAEIKAIIDENLDILLKDGAHLYAEKEIIQAHPDAFEAIYNLGEAALPYLNVLGDFSQTESIGSDTSGNMRCFMANAAAYAIKPDMCAFVSPNGAYSIQADVDTYVTMEDPFQGILYRLRLEETETGAVLVVSDGAHMLYADPFGDYSNIVWSPDSRYASVKIEYRHYDTIYEIFDVDRKLIYVLPGGSELEEFLDTELIFEGDSSLKWDRVQLSIDEWGANTVKVRLFLTTAAGGEMEAGYYLYDLENQCIICAEFDPASRDAGEIADVMQLSETVSYTTHNRRIKYGTNADINVHASYPQLDAPNAEVCSAINHKLSEFVTNKYDVMQFLTEDRVVPAAQTFSSEMQYEISLCNLNFVSVHFYGLTEGFGSPADVFDTCFTFDIRTGDMVSLFDFYSADQIAEKINCYFDEMDESRYPTVMRLTDKETIRSEFLEKYNAQGSDADAVYYITEDTLYLFAGWYKGYTIDTDAPFQGRRSFMMEISRTDEDKRSSR